MGDEKDNAASKAKPDGDADPDTPKTPDVNHEGWSAEQIEEQASNKDATEVKAEINQGKQVQRKGNR